MVVATAVQAAVKTEPCSLFLPRKQDNAEVAGNSVFCAKKAQLFFYLAILDERRTSKQTRATHLESQN